MSLKFLFLIIFILICSGSYAQDASGPVYNFNFYNNTKSDGPLPSTPAPDATKVIGPPVEANKQPDAPTSKIEMKTNKFEPVPNGEGSTFISLNSKNFSINHAPYYGESEASGDIQMRYFDIGYQKLFENYYYQFLIGGIQGSSILTSNNSWLNNVEYKINGVHIGSKIGAYKQFGYTRFYTELDGNFTNVDTKAAHSDGYNEEHVISNRYQYFDGSIKIGLNFGFSKNLRLMAYTGSQYTSYSPENIAKGDGQSHSINGMALNYHF